jgi:8-hydroxy-5-deazaflavin:NADPH oxidoreductase
MEHVAIIGLGNIGSRLAKNLASGGVSLILADTDEGKAKQLADTLGQRVTHATLDQAIERADIVIFAVWFDVIQRYFDTHAAQLAGKIVVDTSNPIAPDNAGGFRKILPQDQSSGQVLASLLPAGARLVKAFGTLGAASLTSGANRRPTRAVEFYAADDAAAGDAVAKLIDANGFDPVKVGGIDQSIRIEVFGDLHEFGKLGRLVSADEAAQLV